MEYVVQEENIHKLSHQMMQAQGQGTPLALEEFISTTDLREITQQPHIGCCVLEMFTKVIVIFWFSRIAVLKNINVCCSCGNLYNDIITCNIILYMLTFKKNRGPRGYNC